MEFREVLSHVRIDGSVARCPKPIQQRAVLEAAKISKSNANWKLLDDEHPILERNLDCIISNPPYSETLDGKNAAGRKRLNPVKWKSFVRQAHDSLRPGGILVLIAPIGPGDTFSNFEVLESYTEDDVTFNDGEVYTRAYWCVLRKKPGGSSKLPFTAWANFSSINLYYHSAKTPHTDLEDGPKLMMDLSTMVVEQVGPKYNTNKVLLTGPQADLDRFQAWSKTDDGKRILLKIKGPNYAQVALLRARLSMKGGR